MEFFAPIFIIVLIIVFLAVLIRMRKGYFNIFSFQMDNIVKALCGHIVVQQIFQSMA